MIQMTDGTASSSKTVQLSWSDRDGTLTVTPENEDRFSLRIQDAIESLKTSSNQKRIQRQFDFLLNRLANWCKSQEGILSSHVTVRSGEFLFVVVQNAAVYQEVFEDALTDLDIELANDPDLDELPVSVLALPNVSEDSLESFLHPTIRFRLRHATS